MVSRGCRNKVPQTRWLRTANALSHSSRLEVHNQGVGRWLLLRTVRENRLEAPLLGSISLRSPALVDDALCLRITFLLHVSVSVSLMTSDVKHLLICLLAICVSSLKNVCSNPLPIF